MTTRICTFAGLSDVGRLRQNNEDNLVWDEQTSLAVLADGMGGYNAGEVASQIAVERIRDSMKHWLSNAPKPVVLRDLKQAMEAAADTANREIFDAAYTNPIYAGMGTTLVFLSLLMGDRVVIGHAGDSRAYRFRGNVLTQLTRDHSLLQEQVDAGLLTPEQVHAFGYRNFITRALGVEDTVVLEVNDFEVQNRDVYLLCSDGLTDMVDAEDIATVMGSDHTLEDKTQQLVEWANSNGGRDNVTVLLVQVTDGVD